MSAPHQLASVTSTDAIARLLALADYSIAIQRRYSST